MHLNIHTCISYNTIHQYMYIFNNLLSVKLMHICSYYVNIINILEITELLLRNIYAYI